MKKIILGILGIVLVLAIAMFLKNKSQKKVEFIEESVGKGEVVKTINVDAEVTPDIYADISTELPSLIKTVKVKKGDRVEVGQILFTLDKKSINAQINNARLGVQKAELEEKKARRKWDMLKPEERERIKKTTEQSRQTLNELYAQANKTTIVSPIDGVIIEQNARVGEVAQGIIVKIIQPNSLKIEALIPEVDISKVKIGQPVEITFDAYSDKKIKGVIKSIDINSTVKQYSTYYKADISLNDRQGLKILEGMNAEIDIEINKKDNVLRVDRKFAKKDEQGYFVYIKDDTTQEGKRKKYFQAGLIGDNFVEIVSGLNNEEKAVLEK